MSISTRLQKVTQSLSPLQRALLVLQALRDGREPDPDVRRIDDAQERRAFNRYMALLWVANYHLGSVAAIIAHRVEVAEDGRHHFELFNEVADLLDEQEGLKPSKAVSNWRERKGTISVQSFLRSLALECKEQGVRQVLHLWQETQALEAVWQELREEYAGEDIVLAEHHEQAEDTRSRLGAVARALGLRKLPPEPEAAYLDAYRNVVSDSFRRLGMVEV